MTGAPMQPAISKARPALQTHWGALLARLVLVPLVMTSLIWSTSFFGYLLFHSLAEMFSIIVAGTALVVATTSSAFTRNQFTTFIAVAIGWSAGIDLVHVLVFKGMHIVSDVTSANPATQLWVAARGMQAVALVIAPLMLARSVSVWTLHLVFGLCSALCLWSILAGYFPVAYIEGQGLSDFKVTAEYVIIALFALSLALMWGQRRLMTFELHLTLSLALVFMMGSEFAFTKYVSVYAQANLIGHLLKIYAFWCVYLALVQSTLREPFGALARSADTYDAVPDPTFLLDAEGTISQANAAAATLLGRPVAKLVGRSVHVLFHNPAIKPEDCNVCSHLSEDGKVLVRDLELPDGRSIECALAPFSGSGRSSGLWVCVQRDITDRRRMTTEREALLYDLGERVKELRCISVVAELLARPDMDLRALLASVVAALAPGFTRPDLLRALISSNWGHFGDEMPTPAPLKQLSAEVVVDRVAVGRICVWYPDVATEAHFLREEVNLLNTVAQHLAEAVQRNRAAERVQRLSYLYETMVLTNKAIAGCKNRDDLLEALLGALAKRGAYPFAFISVFDDARMPGRLALNHAIPQDQLAHLADSLADMKGPLADVFPKIAAGEVICQNLTPFVAGGHPEHDLPGTAEWLAFLNRQNINSRIVMPLMCQGELVACVALYLRTTAEIDDEERSLFENLSDDVGLALDSFAAGMTARQMGSRFEGLFDGSPLPTQIFSLRTGKTLAMNAAMKDWLGYQPDELKSVKAALMRFFPDPETRDHYRALWDASVAEALTGKTVTAERVSLTCSDGSLRQANALLTVVNDDAIISWVDLTEINRSAEVLRESEGRFRTMVEQAVNGIFVRRDGRYIYVNRRYCEMTGWSEAELLGQDVLNFTPHDEANLENIHKAWAESAANKTELVKYDVPLCCKDGRVIELAFTARAIVWDDGLPAVIVIADDITERKHADAQIAAYVGRLETSMRGTLLAVSQMVEMRDPYTAGHERRVGLIASAIAAEMGWDEKRCRNLELMGLVHDIGKIGVPAEILTKPTQLTPLEYEFVKGHAQAGYDILKGVPFDMPVADVIHQHHERMDGSGYPQGLIGDAILPEARILGVADVLESMSSHRPYRAALGIDAAMAEVEAHRGTLFDPEVVDAAHRLIRDKGYVLPS